MTLLAMGIAPSAWNARTVRKHLIRLGASLEMTSDCLEEFVTAVNEAFENAVEHAKTDAPIEITIKVDHRRRLVATVRDRGCGIDTASIPAGLPPAAAERGRGIPLMRRCSSSMTISVPPGGGTLVVLRWERLAAERMRARA